MTTVSYAYKRFSSGRQKKGDSEARQGWTAERAAERKGWLLDDTLDLTDRGVSAFRSANSLIGKLGKFIKHVDEGTVKPGSVLMVENLDRLSRDQIDNALTLTRDILRRGVHVYEIQDDVLYTRADLNEPMKLMLLIVKYARAHDESATKSRRSARNWSKMRSNLGKKKMTKMVPYWLQLRPDRTSFAVIEERAEMVRDIFRWCVDGVGIATIAARLNAAGRKTGHQCKQVGSSSVQKILRNRAVLGEFTPMSGRGEERKPGGDTVKDYYPRIVDEGLWTQAQLALNGRGFAQGRKSKKVNNLFERIAYNARDGYKLTFRDALPPRRPTSRLLSVGAIVGWPGSDYGSFHYDVVESAILRHLSELDVASIFPDRSSADRLKLSAMKEELEQIDADLKQLNEEMAQPGMAATLLPAVRRLVARKNKLTEDSQVLNAKCVSPDADQLQTVQELLRESGGFNPTDENTRLRLRSAIQRIISGISLLGVSRGQDRLCAVQVDFRGGARRSYLIRQRPPKGNRHGKGLEQGYWQVRCWTDEGLRKARMPAQFDLRHADPTLIGEDDEGHSAHVAGWEDVARDLLAADVEALFAGCERHPLP